MSNKIKLNPFEINNHTWVYSSYPTNKTLTFIQWINTDDGKRHPEHLKIRVSTIKRILKELGELK